MLLLFVFDYVVFESVLYVNNMDLLDPNYVYGRNEIG